MLSDYFSKNLVSLVLVGLQFLFLGLVIASGPILHLEWYWWLVMLVGGFIGGWAALVMWRQQQFQITSDPVEGAELISRGPYKLIRHPMYTSILILAWALTLGGLTWNRLSFTLGLTMVLVIKSQYEEQLLRRIFPTYDIYITKTDSFVPLIY